MSRGILNHNEQEGYRRDSSRCCARKPPTLHHPARPLNTFQVAGPCQYRIIVARDRQEKCQSLATAATRAASIASRQASAGVCLTVSRLLTDVTFSGAAFVTPTDRGEAPAKLDRWTWMAWGEVKPQERDCRTRGCQYFPSACEPLAFCSLSLSPVGSAALHQTSRFKLLRREQAITRHLVP